MNISKKIYFALFFLLLPISNLYSQFSNDPNINLTVCDTVGSQSLSKIAPTNDGGCYISWFDNRSGNYAVYLQKLDAYGNKQFSPNGLLISNNPQRSSLVDYDLQVDALDNAIIAFTDIRNGSQINPFAYKISPTGEFLWGPNGVFLGDYIDIFQANPKIACASDGNYWFVWIHISTPQKIGIQKLNSNGVKQFGPTGIYLQSSTSGENFDYSWNVASDNGSTIVMWCGYSGSFINPGAYKLYSQKFGADGTPLWNSTMDTVYSLGRVSGFYTPRIFSDGQNGAVYCWQDDRNATSISNCYVQRQRSDGTFLFPINGSAVGTNTTLRFEPMAAIMPETNDTYLYWQQKNSAQSLIGVYGQRFDSTGTPLWDATTGKAFKPMDQNSFSSLMSFAKAGKVSCFYLETLFGSNNSLIKGFSNDANGNMLWPNGIVTVSSRVSNKIKNYTCRTTSGMFVCSWQDGRIDNGIYAQNIMPDGSLPVELNSFYSIVNGNSVTLNWSTSSEKNNKGFFVERRSSNYHWEEISFVHGIGTSTEAHNYSYTDKNLSNNTYNYRLRQMDLDGSFNYSKVIEAQISSPSSFSLLQNYPNPFNPLTLINFSVPEECTVELIVYDVIGRKITTLVNEVKSPGIYTAEFHAAGLSSGIYFYKFTAGIYTNIKKMIFIK